MLAAIAASDFLPLCCGLLFLQKSTPTVSTRLMDTPQHGARHCSPREACDSSGTQPLWRDSLACTLTAWDLDHLKVTLSVFFTPCPQGPEWAWYRVGVLYINVC